MKNIVPSAWSYLEDYFGIDFSLERKQEAVHEPNDAKEDYLHRGERIMSMLRKKGEKEFAKILLSKLEEIIYSIAFRKGDGFSDIIETLAKKVFRPYIRSMEEADVSAFFNEESLFRVSVTFLKSGEMVCGKSALRIKGMIGKSYMECTLCEVRVQEVDGYSFRVYGLKEKAHPERSRNLSFAGNEMCADLAYFFSSLYVFDVAKRAYGQLLKDRDFLSFLEERASKEAINAILEGQLRFCYHDYMVYEARSGGYHPFAILEPHSIHHMKRYEGKEQNFLRIEALFLAEQDRRNGIANTFRYYNELQKAAKAGGHARCYQTKKDIPKKILEAMEQSGFLKWFSYVEYDQETDLEKAALLAEEFKAIHEAYLSDMDAEASQNILRFRKLGNYKALGLYFPFLRCLCVDVRSPESFMHEYGHLMDYTKGKLSKRGGNFEGLYKAYETYLREAMEKDPQLKEELSRKSKYNLAYFLEPTEVFARSFELYLSKCKGVHNSLVPVQFNNKYPQSQEYLALVEGYFDALLHNHRKEDVA